MNHFESIVCQLSSAIRQIWFPCVSFANQEAPYYGAGLQLGAPPVVYYSSQPQPASYMALPTEPVAPLCLGERTLAIEFMILLETLVDLKDGCGNRLTEVRDRGKVQSRVQGVVQFLFASILFLSKSASAEPAVCYPVDLSILGVRFHQTPRTVVAHRA